jgi:hypothetical protein
MIARTSGESVRATGNRDSRISRTISAFSDSFYGALVNAMAGVVVVAGVGMRIVDRLCRTET